MDKQRKKALKFSILRDTRGQILLSALTIALLVLLLGIGVLGFASVSYRQVKRSQFVSQATSIAEAGVNHAVRQLNVNGNYAGETGTSFGNGVFTVTVTGSGSERTIESTGAVPDATNPRARRKIRVKARVNSDNVQFFYGVQIDDGGVEMSNTASVIGNVYSNGSIIGNNNPQITGNATVAGGIAASPSLEWATHNADHFFATSASNRDIAQSFTATASDRLNRVSVFLGKVGNPTGNMTLRLTTDSGDRPNTIDIANATIFNASVGTTPSWINVSFTNPPTLTSGVKYWIVLDFNANSPVNHWNWRKDTTDGYPGNTGKETSNWNSGGASWTNVGGDLAFRVWIGGVTTRIEGLTIGGTARANLFVNTSAGGSPCPNANCIVENPPRENLPISDGLIQDWKNAAEAGGICSPPTCDALGNLSLSGTQTVSLGPRKITGNLDLSNQSTLILTGTLWVVGNATFQNNCTVRLDPSYGADSGLIIVDGVTEVKNNCTFQGSGTPGSYIMLLSTNPSTGDQDAMEIQNSSVGVIYYAARGAVEMHNSAQARQLTAFKLEIRNSATVTYESGLANVNFASGPGGGWSVITGTWQEIKL